MYPEGFWSKRRTLSEIRRGFRQVVDSGKAAIYLVGFLEVEEVVDTARTGWDYLLDRHPQLKHSPHHARDGDYPVAVIGRGYLVHPPAPLSKPKPHLARQPPSQLLVKIIGREASRALANGNYRRSRLVQLSAKELKEILEGEGYSVKACLSQCQGLDAGAVGGASIIPRAGPNQEPQHYLAVAARVHEHLGHMAQV